MEFVWNAHLDLCYRTLFVTERLTIVSPTIHQLTFVDSALLDSVLLTASATSYLKTVSLSTLRKYVSIVFLDTRFKMESAT